MTSEAPASVGGAGSGGQSRSARPCLYELWGQWGRAVGERVTRGVNDFSDGIQGRLLRGGDI